MEEVFPNYYHKFKCIAGKCTHSCCIGWEIDIDEETMQIYNSLNTEMGERIRKNITGDVPHFILKENERCPFLNESGLCEIICEYGEGALCDICYLHPRFRNFYSDFSETGLGLCCEEAARLILLEEEKFSIALPEKIEILEEEKEFFKKRQEIFCILQNREKSIKERLFSLAYDFGFRLDLSVEKLCKLYMSIERLDEAWTDELKNLDGFSFDFDIFEDKKLQKPFEQLAVYFIFRHLGKAMDDGEYASKVRFAIISCYFIGVLCSYYKKRGSLTVEKMIDLVRMYSSEVEYSEQNTDILINADI